MIRLLLIVLTMSIASTAYAQLSIEFPSSPHASTGDAKLDRAVAACDRHTRPNPLVYPETGTSPPLFEKGWEACFKIMRKWDASTVARKQRQAKAKDEADHAFVNEYIK